MKRPLTLILTTPLLAPLAALHAAPALHTVGRVGTRIKCLFLHYTRFPVHDRLLRWAPADG